MASEEQKDPQCGKILEAEGTTLETLSSSV